LEGNSSSGKGRMVKDGMGKDRIGRIYKREEVKQMVTNDSLKEILERINKDNGGITPQAVVDYARPDGSELHEAFEWDDNVAGEEYRKWQARQLIVRVKIEDTNIPLYHSIRAKINVEQPVYKPIEEVKKSRSLLGEVVNNALNEIEYWQEKYEYLNELAGVVNREKVVELKERYK